MFSLRAVPQGLSADIVGLSSANIVLPTYSTAILTLFLSANMSICVSGVPTFSRLNDDQHCQLTMMGRVAWPLGLRVIGSRFTPVT